MMNGITSAMNPSSSSSSSLLDRNQDGKVDLNDLKNQSIVTSLNDNNSNNNGGRLTGLASNQPMPMVGRMNQDNNINNINNINDINDINNQQSFPSSSSTSSSFIPFDSKGNQYSSSLPQGINRNFVQNQLPSSLEKNPNWMNSSSQFNGDNLNNNLNNNINSNNLATNQQWNSKFPSGINPRELQKKRSIHQQLLGFNGNWNLNKTRTRYTDPLSYETFDSLPTGVRQQQQSSLPNSSFLNSSSQWSTPNKSSLHQELLGKNGNWNLRPVGNQYTSNVRGWNESSSLRDPNWMNSSQLTELERKKMAKREAKAAKRAKKEQKWASLSDEERRIKLAKKEAKREAKAAKKAQKMSSHNRSVPLGSIQQSDFVPASQVRMLPVEVERVEKGVVVHEHIHPIQKEEIQPIIYREREQIDVRQITQQLHETKIQPTVVNQVQLAPEVRQPIVERGMPIQENVVLPSRDIDNTVRTASVKPAIINETVRKTVVEEIQPVLERDVIQPSVIKETQPIYEKVVEAPHIQREVLPTRELGVTNSQMTGRSVSTPLTSTATLPSAYNTTGTYFHGQQHFGTQQGFVNQQGISSNSIPRMSDFAAEGGPITHAEGSLPNVASYGSSQGYLPEQSFVAPSQYQGGLSSFPQQGLANQQFDSFSQSQMTSSLPYQGLQQRSTILPPRQIYTQALPQQSRGFNTFGGISQFAAEGGPIAFAQSVGLNQAPILKTVDPNLMNARQQAPTFFRQM